MSNWQNIVGSCFPGARVTAEHPLPADASTRRYVRLVLAGDTAPPSAIAMVLPEPTPADAAELPFLDVQRHLRSLGVAVPAVYAARDRDRGVLLLEDVGDRPLAHALAEPETTPEESDRLLARVVDVLAALAASPTDAACVAFGRSHDEHLIARELDMILSYGLAGSDHPPVRSPTDDPEARRGLARLGEALAAQPRRLMHRDFHAWNLHVDPRGELRVLDFQDAMLGPPAYDLASFCTDRDSDRFIGAERERMLVGRVGEALAHTGVGLYRDRSAFQHDYWVAVAFRTLRVIGRFRFLALEHGDRRYLAYVPRMARQTRRALAAAGDTELLRLLADRTAYFA